MHSLRSRLTIILTLGLGLLLLGAGIWLNRILNAHLLHEFDQVLLAKAKTLIALTETEGKTVEFDFSDKIMPEFSRPEHPEYFSLWLTSHAQPEKSLSLGEHDLPRQPDPESAPKFRDIGLSNGARGRLVQLTFIPRISYDEDDLDEKEDQDQSEALRNQAEQPNIDEERTQAFELTLEHPATIIVARERTQLDSLMRSLYVALAGGILTLLIAMIVLVRLALKVGLRPLDDVRHQVTQLNADTLTTGIQVTTETRELAPVITQLNSMLERLNAAFVRERQFSSDVAHELRTPLAELRALAEVGGRWPEDQEAVVDYFADTHAICEQMERVVVSLLTLARCEQGVQPIEKTQFNLLETVEMSWMTITRMAQEKSQVFECHIPPDLIISSDRDMLLMVLNNLLCNAVVYSDPKRTICCTVTTMELRPQLTISNPTDALSPQDLSHLFERFWRKDAARSNGSHSGLGLALVKAFSDLLHLDVQAQIEQDHILSITLSLSS